jgi:hypothetical protein
MKTAIAVAVISLLGARLPAADAPPVALSVEQQFEQADVQLSIEQYKKLRMTAFEIGLRLETETALSDEQRKGLEVLHAKLRNSAEELRALPIKRAEVAVAKAR